MRRVGAACLAVAICSLGGCSGADAASEPGDADAAADTGVHESAAETEPADTAPEVELDTGVDTGTVDTADAFEAPPTCPGGEPEPNDTAPEAVPLATIDDCDSSGGAFSGYLADGSDVDYWHFQGNDTFGCSVDPTASTKDSINLCVFVACLHGATRVNGCTDGTPTASQAGLHGCCTDGPGQAVVDFTCTLVGTDDSADVYIRVEDPSASSCQLYDVDYHY